MTVGGSQQLRIFRRARRDGSTLHTAAVLAGMSLAEARLHDADDRANPPPEEAYVLLGENAEFPAEIPENANSISPGDAAPETSGLARSEASGGRDGALIPGAPASPEPRNPQTEETTMGRTARKEPPINGEVPKPDFELAAKIYRDDIKPAQSKVGEHAQEMSTAFKDIKKRAHIQPQAAKAAFKLDEMEPSKRDDWLRSFNGLLKTLKIFMPTDLVDAAEGKGAAGEAVVPTGERPRPQLATVPKTPPPGDTDLAGEDEPQAAE